MNIKLGKVVSNTDFLNLGRLMVQCDLESAITVKYTSPYLANKSGGFIAIPEVGSQILICKPDNAEDWFYIGSTPEPGFGEILGTGFDKTKEGPLFDKRIYRARTSPQRQVFSSPKGNKLVLSDEYRADYANIKVALESSQGKKIELNDSPEIDSVIIRDETGQARIKISSTSNGPTAAKSIEIECLGPLNLISRQSEIRLHVVDGKEINIINESTGAQRGGSSDSTPGNINVISKNGDINMTVKSKNGIIRLDAEGEEGHIVLDSKGTVQISGDKGVSILSNDGDVTIEGNNIFLN